GGTNFARASVIADPRSGPNQGFARPPLTGFRVVATSTVGSVDSAEASKRAPAAPKSAHPPSASALPEEASTPRNARRDAIDSCGSERRTITRNLREPCQPGAAPDGFLNHNGGDK